MLRSDGPQIFIANNLIIEFLRLVLYPILYRKNITIEETIIEDHTQHITEMLENKTIDFLAAVFTPTVAQQQRFEFSSLVYEVNSILINLITSLHISRIIFLLHRDVETTK